jgi:anthranilate synthase component 1
METIDRAQFTAYAAEGYNLVPVSREILADLDTPVSAYMKLAGGPYSYLLESVQGGEKWGRYSMIGLSADRILRVRDRTVTLSGADGRVLWSREAADPLAEIERFQQEYRVPHVPGLPRFTGGLVGYFGYDCVRYIEPRLDTAPLPDPLNCPDILLLTSDRLVIFDNVSGKIILIVHADPAKAGAYDQALSDLDQLASRLAETPTRRQPAAAGRVVDEKDFISGFTKPEYEAVVESIKRYIVEGDVMQVVPSQRLSIPFRAAPLDLYRALRCTNPSPYMYYFDLGDFHIVGASPEILVRLEGDTVTVRPIAGTRPRGRDDAADRWLEEDLLSDPKEIAEHLMLIDLGRNDVGRVADIGTVHVTEQMVVERYSHVMHIVSNVTGKLKAGRNALDVLRATFPAGTVSGAPKIRAMEIIAELEPVKRGIYAGAVGYLSWDGNMDTAIAIRTAVIKDGVLHIQAGGGVVADSVPATEWEETMNKGRSTFRAVAMAEKGLG